jgi:hypothetical protein
MCLLFPFLPALALTTTGSASDDASLMAFMRNMLSGGISGIVSKTIGAPVDRVKLILQTQAVNADVKQRYAGLTDCFTRVYREQGAYVVCILYVCACTYTQVRLCRWYARAIRALRAQWQAAHVPGACVTCVSA